MLIPNPSCQAAMATLSSTFHRVVKGFKGIKGLLEETLAQVRGICFLQSSLHQRLSYWPETHNESARLNDFN